MAHKVKICGLDTSTLPKLTNEESRDLMKKIKSGDEASRERFINGNMRLVLSIVQRFSSVREDSSDDLFQIGCVGLLKAIENFDVSLNVMFSTYAVPMIIGEIRRFLRDSNSIKVSRSIRDTAFKALQARERMISDGKEPAIAEISREIDIPEREINRALDAVSEPVSLFENVYGEGSDSIMLMEQLCDSRSSDEYWTENVSLKESLKSIPERERKILLMRYYFGKTQVEISQAVGISQAQVSRLEKCALERLRNYFD